VFKGSNTKFYFDCDRCGHEFLQVISNVANGTWCGKCKHKTEHLLYNFLLGHFNNLISQFSPEWFGRMRSDFCLGDIKVIIELDGEQHFKQVSNWTAPEITQQNDKLKMELANQHGYSVIRLLQPDVFNDKYDWKKELLEAIKVVKEHPSPTNIFLCKNNEYQVYLE
jgi:very-short-patch-repair endonuclease